MSPDGYSHEDSCTALITVVPSHWRAHWILKSDLLSNRMIVSCLLERSVSWSQLVEFVSLDDLYHFCKTLGIFIYLRKLILLKAKWFQWVCKSFKLHKCLAFIQVFQAGHVICSLLLVWMQMSAGAADTIRGRSSWLWKYIHHSDSRVFLFFLFFFFFLKKLGLIQPDELPVE